MGSLRIIGGELRHRRIHAPPGLASRPTSDRVREALFGILGRSVEGSRVLDAYAGSGALGIEALSRGAADATFVESDPRTRDTLRRNIAALGIEARSRVLRGRVERLLRSGQVVGPFDLVLADPPYAEELGARLLAELAGARALASGGRVVIERDIRTVPAAGEPSGLRLERTARYGRSCLDFYTAGTGTFSPESGTG